MQVVSRNDAISSWMSLEALRNSDMFAIEKETALKKPTAIASVVGLIIGIYMSTVSLREIDSSFYESLVQKGKVTLVPTIDISKPDVKPVTAAEKPKLVESSRTSLKHQSVVRPNKNGGGNNGRPVTQKGVLGLISSNAVTGNSPDIFGKNGFASGIDKVISGVNGVRKGDGGVQRRGSGNMLGEGDGLSSDFGSGTNGSDVASLMDDLLKGGGERSLKPMNSKPRKLSEPSGANSAGISGKRSRAEIMRVVSQNMQSLRYIYNRQLRDKPGMKGEITLKWAIDEFGNVLFCSLVSSTMSDPEFETSLIQAVKQWRFNSIDVVGDVTEVIYPFVFTQ